jgi:DNA-binding beta-propeller fold protein YncE
MNHLRLPRRLIASCALLAFSSAPAWAASPVDDATRAWSYSHASTSGFLSEIVAFDSVNQQLWVSGVSGVDILNASTGAFIDRIAITGGAINSVAIKNGIAAFAIEATDRATLGRIDLYDTTSRTLLAGTSSITVGALPDMVTFTPDGSKLLVANEATPNAGNYGALTSVAGTFPRSYGTSATDPVGSVSIIDMNSRSVVATANPNTAPTSGSHIRTNTGMDFEPEYIAVNASGTKAYVSLQEANAMGVLDINSGSFTSVIGLGVKDFSQPGNRIDPLNNSTNSLISPNVKGLYMPDGVAAYEANGQTYVLMANEGDFREDDADRSAASNLGAVSPLNNLRVSNTDSSAGNLFAAGGRSFSIRDENGVLVYDSGEILDREAMALGLYDDGRSRDKGVEPEGVEVMTMGGRTFAFVGLERTTSSAIGVFDITDPANTSFVRMLTGSGDISPEGLKGFEMGGNYFLAYSNEVTNTTSLFQLAAVPEPGTYAMMALGLCLIGLARRQVR